MSMAFRVLDLSLIDQTESVEAFSKCCKTNVANHHSVYLTPSDFLCAPHCDLCSVGQTWEVKYGRLGHLNWVRSWDPYGAVVRMGLMSNLIDSRARRGLPWFVRGVAQT